ncbi:unnamed protein product [Ceutorhynchus assimilis]|uniref:Myb-like domain-containing protein n=1 Tax=Ceutorhynchus assimilis TaxID=467358 RepID=A0A9N9MSF9_9CUCU|nr:unnamed protein product [Ceutorhynchus assimilis]
MQEELQEFVIILNENEATNIVKPSTSNNDEINNNMEYKWSVNNTKLLIDFYSKYRNKVGTLQIRSLKKLWEIIAEELRKLRINVTPNNCLNRWRVLERNYKKFIDNNSKTGRGRQYFEYASEMEEVLGKKRNVHPELLLSSNTKDDLEHELDTKENNEPIEKPPKLVRPLEPESPQELEGAENINQPGTKQNEEMPKRKPLRSNIFRKKASTMEKMRLDRKIYYDEKLVIEKKKIEQMERRNQLIEERNSILRENKCNCQCIGSFPSLC